MARDSRHGKDRAKQVSLSKRAAESGRKKTDFPVGRVVLMVLGLLAVIAGIFFVRAVIQFVRGYVGGSGGNAEAPKPYEGDSRVAYYLFGLFGEDETKDLEMLSLVCYDKDAKTVHVMQIPTSTYLGETDKWVVPTVGAAGVRRRDRGRTAQRQYGKRNLLRNADYAENRQCGGQSAGGVPPPVCNRA